MSDPKKYLFCGNRPGVLRKMVGMGLHLVDVLLVENPYLRRFCEEAKLGFQPIRSKADLIRRLERADYDVLISNGCPHILPISDLARKTSALFVNIHPSMLPDLRGADPIPGAVLLGRTAGATCHVMSDRVDAGDIVSQIEISPADVMDVTLLYQLSFRAEADVFQLAWERHFQPAFRQPIQETDIYYSFKPSDLQINWNDDPQSIVRRVKAFNNRSKGCRFAIGDSEYKVFDVEWVGSPYISTVVEGQAENQVVFVYEKNVALAKCGGLLVLKQIEGDLTRLGTGMILSNRVGEQP